MIHTSLIQAIAPSSIAAKHWHELTIGSGIDPAIVALNFRSMEGDSVIERLAGDRLGGVGAHGAQYVTGPVQRILKRYEKSTQGGWWVTGLDPLNNWAPLDWGQFKADTPDLDGKGRPKKYASPEGQKPRALFLRVSWRAALKIATRHGYGKAYRQRIRGEFASAFQAEDSRQGIGNSSVAGGGAVAGDDIHTDQNIEHSQPQQGHGGERPEGDDIFASARGFGANRSRGRAQTSNRVVRLLTAVKSVDDGFWGWWLSIPDAPIVLTEGAKKSGAGLSAGYATVGLVGVNAGYRVKDVLGNRVPPELVEDIKRLVGSGRPITLAFDQDIKPTAQRRVIGALMRFGGLLAAAGCIVTIAEWRPEQGKGIDDLVANHGPNTLHRAIGQALTLDEWRLKLTLDNCLGGVIPSMRVNTRDLATLDPGFIPESGIIAMRSAKGTGKTNLIADLVSGGGETLALGHRIVLMRNLCRRLGVNYRGDIDRVHGEFIDGDGYTLRIGGCVDGTLLAIDPEKFRGCDLVLDEFVQLMRHLLTSSTCNKDGARPVLLARFTQLVQAARRVIVADADLDKTVLDYIATLRGDGAPVWLLVNDAKAEPWPVTFVDAPDASAVTGMLLSAVEAGQRVLVVTDSKAGSKRLDCLIAEVRQAGGPGRVLLLNSDTSGGEVERTVITDPNAHITDYQVVIATPSMATGVSIEVEHFDGVYGVFWGASSTDADMAQALARVRQPIPRVVWCAKYGRNFSKVSRDTNPLRLKKLLQDKTSATAQLTAASLGALGAEITGYDWLNPHVDLWAKIEAQRNRSMLNLRSALKVRLIHEGHHLTIELHGTDRAMREQMAAVRLQIKEAEAAAISAAANLTLSEVTALEKAEAVDPDERLALQKWHMAEFYAVPLDDITADLVLRDNDGRYRGQLRELEAMIYPDIASSADVRSVENQSKHKLGICPWDVSTAELRRQMRQRLNLQSWIDTPDEWQTDSADLASFASDALDTAPQVKAALNVSLRPDMTPQQILGQLLDQMGIATVSRQYRDGGKVRRAYSVDQDAKDAALAVLDRRAARRSALAEPVTPPPVYEYEPGGCDSQIPPIERCSWAGQVVRFGTSLSPWVVLSTDADMATIKMQNPVYQTVRTVPLADIACLEVAV